ncbi:SRPBCC family protein [Methyloferula stellata]|uniref:SRPBCC family protein n=1 Tax=Methyloferula stellata TaxID=876270 RepID=UPI0003A6683F
MRGLKVLIGGAAALALLVPLAVEAHGPSRQKVSETVEINVPAAKVWARIGNFQDIGWLPGVEKTEGTGGNADKATRKITLKGGATVDEELYAYSAEKMSYSYRITQVDVKVLPVNNYSSTITVTPEGDGKSTVEWRGAFYRGFMNNDPPPELSDEAASKAVSGLYRSGLDSLKKELEGSK